MTGNLSCSSASTVSIHHGFENAIEIDKSVLAILKYGIMNIMKCELSLDQDDEITLGLGRPAVMPEKTGSQEYIPEMWLISPSSPTPLSFLHLFSHFPTDTIRVNETMTSEAKNARCDCVFQYETHRVTLCDKILSRPNNGDNN